MVLVSHMQYNKESSYYVKTESVKNGKWRKTATVFSVLKRYYAKRRFHLTKFDKS